MPLVSILIPAYNQPQYIKKAVESALAQDYPNLEVIVSDDSTNYDTEVVLREIKNEGRLHYGRNTVRKGRVGNYRHLLYHLAKGDWVLMLDGDDYLTDSHYISEAMLLRETDNEIVLLGATLQAINEQGTAEAGYSLASSDIVFDGKAVFSIYNKVPAHQTCLYPRKLAMELDFYRDPSAASDSESLFRLCLLGKVGYIGKSVAVWRVHESNTTYTRNIGKQVRELNFIDSIYKAADHYIDKSKLEKWRKTMYTGVSTHLLHLAFASGQFRYVFMILLKSGKYLGWKLSLVYALRTIGWMKQPAVTN